MDVRLRGGLIVPDRYGRIFKTSSEWPYVYGAGLYRIRLVRTKYTFLLCLHYCETNVSIPPNPLARKYIHSGPWVDKNLSYSYVGFDTPELKLRRTV